MDHDDTTREDEATLQALGRALPRTSPPPGLGDQIMRAVAADASADPPAEVIPIASRRRRTVLTSLAVAACSAALAVGVTVWVAGGSDAPGALTASTRVVADGGVTGTAELYAPGSPGGTLRVVLADVPPPPPGHHYEVWVLAKGSQEMIAVGSFMPASPDVDLSLPLPAPAAYSALDISVESNDGPPAHSATSLAGATFV